jgi:hypothetical protein
MAWLADGQVLQVPLEQGTGHGAAADSKMVLQIDGVRNYADIAAVLAIPLDVALARVRPLHLAGILRPTVRPKPAGADV